MTIRSTVAYKLKKLGLIDDKSNKSYAMSFNSILEAVETRNKKLKHRCDSFLEDKGDSFKLVR